MFGFGKNFRDPLADVKTAERWLASFPPTDPLAIQHDVLAELGRLTERSASRTPQGLEAVFHVDSHTEELRRMLTEQYIEHAARSSRIETQIWQSLFDLTQGFLICYGAFAHEVTTHGQSNRWQAMLPELIARQMTHLGHDARIRHFRYEQWIPAKWAELHTLFTLACSKQIERQPLPVHPDGGTTTIEHEYLIVLVLQLLNSGNLSARQLEWVWSQLDEWCQPLRLSLEPPSVNAFYVDLGSRTGLRRRLPAPLEGRVLFLDTRGLHALLLQNVVVIEQKIKGQPLSTKTSRRSEQLNLLTKLASQVDPEFRPFARRGERSSAEGSVDAIVGLARISGYLREEERAPVPAFDIAKSFGGTMELAVFGRARDEKNRRREQATLRLAQFAAPGGPWEVKDVSQTGFRLLAPMSAAGAVTLGTLTAIRPNGQVTWSLGIVRRMRRLTTERAEIGLQVIANALVSVALLEQRKTVNEEYSVDGVPTTTNGRIVHGLLLTLRKRESDPAVRSLIVPAVEYQPSKRFRIDTSESATVLKLGRLLEQQPDWVWTAVEPVEITSVTEPARKPAA